MFYTIDSFFKYPKVIFLKTILFILFPQIFHKAFEVAEEHLGIPPKIAARDLYRARTPDTLTIMAYLSLYYEALHQETPGRYRIL